MSSALQPQITLLEGIYELDTPPGKAKLMTNIQVCVALADVIRSLGPRAGMDKFISLGSDFTANLDDGATINILHATAAFLIHRGQFAIRDIGGDAATTMVLLVAEFLKEAQPLVEKNVHPKHLIKSYRKASSFAVQRIKELAVSIEEGKGLEKKETLLAKFASATLSSMLIGDDKEFLATMAVDAVLATGNEDRPDTIVVEKVPGGTIRDSFLMNGIALKKTCFYADIEPQRNKILNPKILLLNIELEWTPEIEYEEMMRFPDALLYRVKKCVRSGADIVLSQLPIDDLGTKFFAAHDIYCAGGVSEEDLNRVAAATGGTVQTTSNNIIDGVLGSCDAFEELQVGSEQFYVFRGCLPGRTATIILRGDADEFIEEAEFSLHHTIKAVKRVVKSSTVVAGGGAIDMEISRYLIQNAHTLAKNSDEALLAIKSYAKALEVIPRQLCDNAGFDATDVLNKLRQKHALPSGEGASYGVDVSKGGIADSFANFVRELADVKINIIEYATKAACTVLKVGENDGENDTAPESLIGHKDTTYLGRRVQDRAGLTRRQLRKMKLWGAFLCLESIFVTVLLLGRFPFVCCLTCLLFAAFWGMLVKVTITMDAKS